MIVNLIDETIHRIKKAPNAPRPCILSFSGIDETKISIFKDLGFKKIGNKYQYYTQDGFFSYETEEYIKEL